MNPLMTNCSSFSNIHCPVIVALDFDQPEKSLEFARKLDPSLCQVKIGKELFTASGRSLAESLIAMGHKLFLDLKYHDIPNTVASACKIAAQMGVWMVDVHTLGGKRMMMAAREAIDSCAHKPLLIGVTVLTSMEKEDLEEVGITHSPEEMVLRLAKLAQNSGLDGVVCSAQEAQILRKNIGSDFILVTPGIRLNTETQDDQRRIMTPKAAISSGATYLVMGRPITKADDPIATLIQINDSIKQGVLE